MAQAQSAEEVVVRRAVRVRVPVERAFSIFVEQMETWWPKPHHIGTNPFETIFVEPRVGGRWYERDAQGNQCDWGQVLAWGPPNLVTLSWHLGPDWKFNPDITKASEIEIRFTAEGTNAALVELTHSALERHGEGYLQLRNMLESPNAWTSTMAEFEKAANAQ